MAASRSYKEELKAFWKEIHDLCKIELKKAIDFLEPQGKLISDKKEYDRLFAEVTTNRDARLANPDPASSLLGLMGGSSMNKLSKELAESARRRILETKNSHFTKDPDLWIINFYVESSLADIAVRRAFNVKKFEIRLLAIRNEFLERDFDRSENPLTDFQHFAQRIIQAHNMFKEKNLERYIFSTPEEIMRKLELICNNFSAQHLERQQECKEKEPELSAASPKLH
ncbi:MAG: hypothetical protein P4M14_03040 [Gammaproteobacteria bacterium]|nr:hypothetical protein [Gammaproteobacteria bacterium]